MNAPVAMCETAVSTERVRGRGVALDLMSLVGLGLEPPATRPRRSPMQFELSPKQLVLIWRLPPGSTRLDASDGRQALLRRVLHDRDGRPARGGRADRAPTRPRRSPGHADRADRGGRGVPRPGARRPPRAAGGVRRPRPRRARSARDAARQGLRLRRSRPARRAARTARGGRRPSPRRTRRGVRGRPWPDCQKVQTRTVGPAPEIVAPSAPSSAARSTSSIERG